MASRQFDVLRSSCIHIIAEEERKSERVSPKKWRETHFCAVNGFTMIVDRCCFVCLCRWIESDQAIKITYWIVIQSMRLSE